MFPTIPLYTILLVAVFETAALFLCSDIFKTKIASKVSNPVTQNFVYSPTSSTCKKIVIRLLILVFFSFPLYLNFMSLYLCFFPFI